MNQPWTLEEEDRLRDLYATMSSSHLAKVLGRSKSSVRMKLNRLGIIKGHDHLRFKPDDNQKLWLRLNYPHMRNCLCAMYLNISDKTLARVASEMGLQKSPQFLEDCRRFYATHKKKKKHETGN